jgi:hypothetical protein
MYYGHNHMPIRNPISAKEPIKKGGFPLLAIWLIAGLILVALLAVWLGGKPWQKPSVTPKLETSLLIEKVGKHILVNQSEEPTVATVQDPEALRQTNPEFYKDASAGDRLLIWSDKAILYSETRDQIIAVLPVTFFPPPAQTPTSTAETPTEPERLDVATIEIRNGTLTPGLAGDLSDKLTAAGFKVSKARDAMTKGYTKTEIFDKSVSTSTEYLMPMIGNAIGDNLQVVTTTKETGISGDILIVIGSDYTQ